MSRIVILDVDGVLLNWRDTYVDWLKKFEMIADEDSRSYSFKDFIRIPGDADYKSKNTKFADALSEIFNQTYLLSKLPPQDGAVSAIRTLSEAGYVLKVVSAYTTQYEAMKSREYNLKSVFGNVFQEITSLPLHSSKADYLSKQDKDAYFVEDSLGHLLDAQDVGFSTENLFLFPSDWNKETYSEYLDDLKYIKPDGYIRRVNWKEITESILG